VATKLKLVSSSFAPVYSHRTKQLKRRDRPIETHYFDTVDGRSGYTHSGRACDEAGATAAAFKKVDQKLHARAEVTDKERRKVLRVIVRRYNTTTVSKGPK
jgi:hypothetical protein